MQKITSAADLKKSIQELEVRTKKQEAAIKDELKTTGESIKQNLKPANLMKEGLRSVRQTPDIKTVAINTFVGLAAGFITRKFIVGTSRNIIRRTIGAAAQAAITRYVYQKLPFFRKKAADAIAQRPVLHAPSPATKRSLPSNISL